MPKKKSSVMNFSVLFDGDTYSIDVLKEVAIDVSDMNDELERQPGKYAQFAMLYVLSKSHAANCKRLKEVTYAELDSEIRQDAKDNGNKITENAISQEIAMRTEYNESCEECVAAEEQMNRLKSMCISLDQRREMLLALNANIRKEMEGI